MPVGSSEKKKKKEKKYPELTIAGPAIKNAQLEELTQVGTEIKATVTLIAKELRKEEGDVDWSRADEWKNRFEFSVKEMYVDDLIGKDAGKTDQEKFEEGLIGTTVKKSKALSKQEAIGDY